METKPVESQDWPDAQVDGHKGAGHTSQPITRSTPPH